jgi:hypothetical protein
MVLVFVLVSGVLRLNLSQRSTGAGLETPTGAAVPLWSAATRRRFPGLADWSAKQRRAERRVGTPAATAAGRLVRPETLDGGQPPAESGESSPHSKGFAGNLVAQVIQQFRSF